MFCRWMLCLLLAGSVTSVSGQVLRFVHTRFDFGVVPESAGSVSHEFRFVNTGNVPLILTDVRSSCDCTVPEWPQQPILPRKEGVIRVVYETTGNPGVFDKTVTVHSNMRGGPVLLRITGSVERSVIPDLPEFSEAMGPLKFRKRYLSLGEVTHRQVITQEVEVYNPGKQPVRIAAGEVPGFLEVLPSPSLLQPGQKGRIHLVYDVSARKDWGYVADRVHLRINGATKPEYSLLLTADISEDFSRLTSADRQQAPRMEPDRTEFGLGNVRAGEKKQVSVGIRNAGSSPLLLRKLDTGCECLRVEQAPASVPPGGSAVIRCSFTGEPPLGNQQRVLSIRSNDPERPLQQIRIMALVVE